MNFFRSEEHLRNWARFTPETEDGIISFGDLVNLFQVKLVQRRLDPDYVSQSREYGREMVTTMKEIGKAGPFWLKPKA
jgi:hypothetical protein